MKRIRLFTALAAFGPVASMLSLAVTGAAAARTVTLRPASVRAVRPALTPSPRLHCSIAAPTILSPSRSAMAVRWPAQHR